MDRAKSAYVSGMGAQRSLARCVGVSCALRTHTHTRRSSCVEHNRYIERIHTLTHVIHTQGSRNSHTCGGCSIGSRSDPHTHYKNDNVVSINKLSTA